MNFWRYLIQEGGNVYARRLRLFFLFLSCSFALLAAFLTWRMLALAPPNNISSERFSAYDARSFSPKISSVRVVTPSLQKPSVTIRKTLPPLKVGYERVTLPFSNNASLISGDSVHIVYGMGARRVRLFQHILVERVYQEKALATLQVTQKQREILDRLHNGDGQFFLTKSPQQNNKKTQKTRPIVKVFMPEAHLPVTIVQGGSFKKILPSTNP